MFIAIVLAQQPSYSETFFNSKIKGLIDHGYTVQLYVQKQTSTYNHCKVNVAPKVSTNMVFQAIKTFFVFLSLLPNFKRVYRFVLLEIKAKRSFIQIIKNCYNNSHLLKSKANWLHFGFATIALQSENVAKSIGAKMAVSCRGFDLDFFPNTKPDCYHLTWKTVDKVHVISNYLLTKAHSLGLPKNKPTTVINPAIDCSLFSSKPSKKVEFNNPIVFTTIARLHKVKGLFATLEALAILKNNGLDFKYTIIGDGDLYDSLLQAIDNLKLNKNVTLLGKQKLDTIIQYLNNTDIYLQYSLTEGFCNAVLEAQALGCLCVVSDGGALPENVIDNRTGWVVNKNNPKYLAKKIASILQLDIQRLSVIRDNAQQRVKRDFNTKNQIQQFVDFYKLYVVN